MNTRSLNVSLHAYNVEEGVFIKAVCAVLRGKQRIVLYTHIVLKYEIFLALYINLDC